MLLRAVEKGEWRGDGNRRLFWELDHPVTDSLADDRIKADAAGGCHRGRAELLRGADPESGRIERPVAVEFGFDPFKDRREFAVDR
jgi:hypothetical protein